ncbi:coiled-coil domain-containing protein 96 [Tribolium castaneum]|nr:PREDICTED: coiled-coil domain-containing protein 96 [Tribolium castaneum]|eukprot:XP_970780.1 PREDICTED: coiled-coil domain-containing protein 96 [Tribolium castaneum]
MSMSEGGVSIDTVATNEVNLTENESPASPETEALQEEAPIDVVGEQKLEETQENEAEKDAPVGEINRANVTEENEKKGAEEEETPVMPVEKESVEEGDVVKEEPVQVDQKKDAQEEETPVIPIEEGNVAKEESMQVDQEEKSSPVQVDEKEKTTEAVDKNIEDVKSVAGTEEYDFGHLVAPDAISEMSFALLPEELPKIEESSKETIADQSETEEPKKKKTSKKKKIRPSIVKRESDEYPSLRISGSQSLLITGDFAIAPIGSKPQLPSLYSEATEDEGEVEEEEEVSEEEEIHEMTEAERLEYYQKYDRLSKEHDEVKLKNDELLRRLANYYKRKKMYHVLHEGKVQLDAQKKYEKQLDDYSLQAEQSKKEQLALQTEIADLKQRCTVQERETNEAFEKLQREEFEVGKEIINSEAGKGHEEKFIERYLKRQRIQLNNLVKVRYDYIKIRNKLNETQEALNAIDNLGSNLHLIDYEQLKLDNRNLQDKFEERDLELNRVRRKCQNAVQILAHRREKNAALDADITYLNERLEGVSGEYEDVREQLNQLKMERDGYRAATNKIIANSGLLSRPTLLRDLMNTMEEMEELEKRLLDIKWECETVNNKVKKIRENMASETKMNKIRYIMEGKEFSDSFSGATLSNVMVGTVAG